MARTLIISGLALMFPRPLPRGLFFSFMTCWTDQDRLPEIVASAFIQGVRPWVVFVPADTVAFRRCPIIFRNRWHLDVDSPAQLFASSIGISVVIAQLTEGRGGPTAILSQHIKSIHSTLCRWPDVLRSMIEPRSDRAAPCRRHGRHAIADHRLLSWITSW